PGRGCGPVGSAAASRVDAAEGFEPSVGDQTMPRDGGVDTVLGDSGRAVTHAPRRLQHLFAIDQRMPELAGEVTDHGDLLIQVRVVPGLLLVPVGDAGDEHQYSRRRTSE